jgi:pentatricopeptide repeat protein
MLNMYAKNPVNLNAIDKLYQDMKDKGIELTSVAYAIMMNAFSLNSDKVESLYVDLKKRGIIPTEVIFGTLIKAYANAQKPSKYMFLYNDIKDNFSLSDVALNMLLSACSISKRYSCYLSNNSKFYRLDLAEIIWKDMNDKFSESINSTSYTIMINLYANNQQLLKSIELIDSMFERDIPIYGNTFEGILKYLTDRNISTEHTNYLKDYFSRKGEKGITLQEWKKITTFLGAIKKKEIVSRVALGEMITRHRSDPTLAGNTNNKGITQSE